jgi:hypothetical protein
VLFLVSIDDVEGLEVVVDIDPEARPALLLVLGRHVASPPWQVPNVADRRLDDKFGAQEGSDRLCLRR